MRQMFNVCLRKQSANACPFRVKKSSVIKNDMIGYDRQIRVLAYRFSTFSEEESIFFKWSWFAETVSS